MAASFRYLDDVAIADAAFEVVGDSSEEIFLAAAAATMGLMIDDVGRIGPENQVSFRLDHVEMEWLLFEFLEELIFQKDARGRLLRVRSVRIETGTEQNSLEAVAWWTPLRQLQGHLLTDVKAVTLYRYKVEFSNGKWKATVVLDV